MSGGKPRTAIILNFLTGFRALTKIKLIKLPVGLFGMYIALACAENNHQPVGALTGQKDSIILRPDFNQYFRSCNVTGAIVLYDYKQGHWIMSDSAAAGKQHLPASTFKIINLLILLETKTIADENELVKWPGKTDTVKYGYRPEIYHDMTVKEAFELSAGWVFVELAKKMGKSPYKKYLAACNYGNRDLSETGDDFWNFGTFAISPINQVEFLKKLYDETLPFSKRNMQIVKRVMLTEQEPGYAIRAKTGWTRDVGINTGWWVGYAETKKGVYFFATKVLQERLSSTQGFANCRKSITKNVLRDLHILN